MRKFLIIARMKTFQVMPALSNDINFLTNESRVPPQQMGINVKVLRTSSFPPSKFKQVGLDKCMDYSRLFYVINLESIAKFDDHPS